MSRCGGLWRIVDAFAGRHSKGKPKLWIWPFSEYDWNYWISKESSLAPSSTFCSAGFLDILQQESAGILLYIRGAFVLARIAWADVYRHVREGVGVIQCVPMTESPRLWHSK